ncbi:MAG: hypothetical protein R6V35_01945 [Candidatus Nanohaloarchaea archaeon]
MDRTLDEFDEKAKEFIDQGEHHRIRDVLREYSMCAAYEIGIELEKPSRFLRMSGVDIDNIDDFTEYRVAKSVIRSEIRKKKKGSMFTRIKKKVNGK